MNNEEYKKILWNSQRCQRNWDLTKTIPKQDIETMLHAISSAPSKQNEKHFEVFVINDYSARKKIYDGSRNFAHKGDESLDLHPDGTINYKRQSQLMANTLFVFCRAENNLFRSSESHAVKLDVNVAGLHDMSTNEKRDFVRKKHIRSGLHSIGIAVGYLLVTTHMLGYKTGVSSGFGAAPVKEVTGNNWPEVIVGVGYEDATRDRTEEHFEQGRFFPSWDKDIDVKWI